MSNGQGDQMGFSGRYAFSGRPGRNDLPRFALHVDIDGPDSLNVVSGTLHADSDSTENASSHFIGRVTTKEPAADGRRLVVEDFTVVWPDDSVVVNRLDVWLSHTAQSGAMATVVFCSATPNLRYGPFDATLESIWFRQVEIDVDTERGADPVEPYDTHLHPDRPRKLPQEFVTIESAYARAGIRIMRSPESGEVIDVSEAGEDARWSLLELHDSMQLHWDAFANRPQWKAWLFLAGKSERERLGGVMFDADIDEPGGVDRQGVAIFTRCQYFYTVDGGYIQMNPPAEAALRRELFFNTIHEMGHLFNLAHPIERREGRAWKTPSWMRCRRSRRALTWMNYPNSAMPGFGANATWFYKRFQFRFDKHELLFLRHAPERHVEMGGDAWFRNHARAASRSIDRRLQLSIRSRKHAYELGEPVVVEVRLKNMSDQPVPVFGNLDPRDGLVEVAVTNPDGVRLPHLPIAHTRIYLDQRVLEPHGAPLFASVDLTVGALGFPFKTPGGYTIEARYTNLDGSAATAAMRLRLNPPADGETVATVNELFNARVGRVLYVGGTRVIDDVNEKLDWVRYRLGPRHPVSMHLAATRFVPLAAPVKVVEPSASHIHLLAAEPDRLVDHLASTVIERPDAAADTLGHNGFRHLVDTFTQSAVDANKRDLAVRAQERMLGLFKSRHVLPSVVDAVERHATELA